MLTFAWNWIVSWIIGWGGIGALVSIVAWLLWYTLRTQLLLHIAIAATVFTIASSYFFTKGYDEGVALITAQWDAANAKAVKYAKARDDSIATDTDAKVKQATDDLQKQADDLKGKVDAYEKDIAAIKGGTCALTDDDVQRLRKF